MVTLKTIAEAIQQVDDKKENLKKAFENLQARSFPLSSFPFSWSNIDSHFTSIQNSVNERFHLLQSLNSKRESESEATACSSLHLFPKNQDLPTSNAQLDEPGADSAPETPSMTHNPVEFAVPRQELKELCEKLDGKGLIVYINERGEEREAIRAELPGAIQSAPEPGELVLDAMLGFYQERRRNDLNHECSNFRRACILVLEKLMEIRANFSDEVREKAKKLALEWKGRLRSSGDLAALGFLHLVAAFGLESEFDKGEVMSYFYAAAKYPQAVPLSRALGVGDKVHGLVEKLLNTGKQIHSVGFIVEFGLTDKFPLVPILNAHLGDVRRNAKIVCNDGKNTLKSQNIAAEKEIVAMTQVIKVIEEQKLETEYPPETLKNRIVQLEKQIEERKRLLSAPAAKAQQQEKRKTQNQPRENKRPRISAPLGHPANARGSTIYSRPAGFYGFSGASVGVPGTPNPALAHLYSSSEPQVPFGYQNQLTAYSGSNLPPQYHSAYHPQ